MKQLKLYNFHFQLNLDAKLNHARITNRPTKSQISANCQQSELVTQNSHFYQPNANYILNTRTTKTQTPVRTKHKKLKFSNTQMPKLTKPREESTEKSQILNEETVAKFRVPHEIDAEVDA
jgi:HD-GYP domain-containing protein (c-di-GMP phosphodiesterase class II)